MTQATPIFRAIMLECERRRQAIEWQMDKFDEYAGLSDRYYAKALHVDAPSGRQAQWGTLQVIIDALFPHGFDLIIKPRPGPVLSENNLKGQLLQLKAIKDPRSQRELMSKLGSKGGLAMLAKRGRQAWQKHQRKAAKARARALSRERRSEIAKQAAKKRWSTPQVVEIKSP